MIRLSKKDDREGLIALWQEAFGDSRKAVELFLDNRYSAHNTVVCEENQKIASMLYLLEGKVIIGDAILNAYYLYAAATLKEYRGKGIMAKMLEKAKILAEGRGVDLICLKPANDSLYDFYSKHGYKTVFKTKIAAVKASETEKAADKLNILDYSSARETAFHNYDRFIWDNDAIIFSTEQHKYYGGKVYRDCNGYCLYSIDNGICYVKEFAFTPDKIASVLSIISEIEQINKFKLDLPIDYPLVADECFMINNGMALFISDKAKNYEDKTDLYLNLTLD